jgi:hypothetical protein
VSAVSVLHLVPALFGTGVVGGAERYALELARHMAEKVPTRLVTFGSRPMEITEGSLPVRVIAGAWHVRGQRNNPLSLSVVPEILRADVIHCHQRHILLSTVAAVAGRLSGRRVFATELGGGGWDVSAYLPTDRWFTGHLHISEYSREVYGHRGKPWARVILGGVEHRSILPGSRRAAATAPCASAVCCRIKGVDDLIAALPDGMALDVVGPVNRTGHVEALKEKSVGKDVAFRHDVGDAELVAAYRTALCVVLPSVYRSTSGSALNARAARSDAARGDGVRDAGHLHPRGQHA